MSKSFHQFCKLAFFVILQFCNLALTDSAEDFLEMLKYVPQNFQEDPQTNKNFTAHNFFVAIKTF